MVRPVFQSSKAAVHQHPASADILGVTQCEAYVLGVLDAQSNRETPGFCLPKKISQAVTTEIVAKFLEEHPETWPAPA
jgi:hypothetical protein